MGRGIGVREGVGYDVASEYYACTGEPHMASVGHNRE